ncbi:MAG: hypothetical protein EHM89_00295 [Acidobacteria bacterium]|nr:MAG: hypothetical protein EHM89_00295 [Acidobacteriota bacterium]
MTPADFIAACGGVLVASFELDDEGRTVGAPSTHNRAPRCGACGRHGHNVKRCTGEFSEPRPAYARHRR